MHRNPTINNERHSDGKRKMSSWKRGGENVTLGAPLVNRGDADKRSGVSSLTLSRLEVMLWVRAGGGTEDRNDKVTIQQNINDETRFSPCCFLLLSVHLPPLPSPGGCERGDERFHSRPTFPAFVFRRSLALSTSFQSFSPFFFWGPVFLLFFSVV